MFYDLTIYNLDELSYKECVDMCNKHNLKYTYIGLILIILSIPNYLMNDFNAIVNKYNLESKQMIRFRYTSGDIERTVFGEVYQFNFDKRMWPLLFFVKGSGGAGTVGGLTGQEYFTIYGPLSGDYIVKFSKLAQELGVPIVQSGEEERWYLKAGPMSTADKVKFQKLADSLNVDYNNNPSGEIPPVINPDQSTKYSRAQFIELVKDYCIYKGKQTGILPSLAIAQAVLESGNGNSGLTAVSNNLFGYKGKYNGSSVMYPTMEQDDNGNWYEIVAEFRSYPNWNASLDDYFSLLSGASRFSNLIGEKDYKEACYKVSADGYATAKSYASTLISIIEVNELWRYDN